jgi:small subunit ribosomal protein S20
VNREVSRVANIKSQQKRIKTSEAARLRDKAVESGVKTAIRKVREAAGDKDKATELACAASRSLDKAAGKGVIHANQAADKKVRARAGREQDRLSTPLRERPARLRGQGVLVIRR